jgi:hypothetical protein
MGIHSGRARAGDEKIFSLASCCERHRGRHRQPYIGALATWLVRLRKYTVVRRSPSESTGQLEGIPIKPDTAIAKEMILDASKNCIFTAEGRLIANQGDRKSGPTFLSIEEIGSFVS